MVPAEARSGLENATLTKLSPGGCRAPTRPLALATSGKVLFAIGFRIQGLTPNISPVRGLSKNKTPLMTKFSKIGLLGGGPRS